MYLSYISNTGKRSAVGHVVSNSEDKFLATGNGKHYEINRDGCYPILRVCCSGQCNTYYRTIGRYPTISY